MAQSYYTVIIFCKGSCNARKYRNVAKSKIRSLLTSVNKKCFVKYANVYEKKTKKYVGRVYMK